MTQQKHASPSLELYFFCATICALLIFAQSFLDISRVSEYIVTATMIFFSAYLLNENGQDNKKLFFYTLLLTFFFTLSFLWPLGEEGNSNASKLFSLFALFASINLLSIFHQKKTLIPNYQFFVDVIWQKITIILILLCFALVISLVLKMLHRSIFLSPSFCLIIYSFLLIMGTYLCKFYDMQLNAAKKALIFCSTLFFMLMTIFSILLFCFWLIKSFADFGTFLSHNIFIYTAFSYNFIYLICFNGAFPYYLTHKACSTRFLKTLHILLRIGPFLGLLIASLMLGEHYNFIAKLTTTSSYQNLLAEETLVISLAFVLIWLYFALYVLGNLVDPQGFFKHWLPSVNLSIAFVLIITTLALTNPIATTILNLKKLDLTISNESITPITEKNALDNTRLAWLPKKDIEKAISFGQRKNKPLYICQTNLHGNTISGEVVGNGPCVIGYNGKLYFKNTYQVLAGKAKVFWAASDYTKPNTLVKGTFFKNSGENYAICRTIYNNEIYLGRALSQYWRCLITSDNKIIEARGMQMLYTKKKTY